MTDYNKAIRDKIPEIIKLSGKNCDVKKLNDSEFLAQLEKKLVEELAEYQESKNVEELADMLEVIYRISELKGITSDELDCIKNEKSKKRGKFDDNLFLVDTD
jgi:predicted house-cleaning noncanonical NTP pyrophosphatase (MazG superfamily)